jgi:hypothetical protein
MVLTLTSEYVKVSCQSYLARMLKAYGWDKPSPIEKSDSKPIEPLAASPDEELSTSVGPAEGSTEHPTLEKEIGFSYYQVFGELTYEYLVGRVGISYAVTLLARHSSTPSLLQSDQPKAVLITQPLRKK